MTHVLGDVELVTKQEVEALLDATVVTEATIDDKIATETTARAEAIDNALAAVAAEKARAEGAEQTLHQEVLDEAHLRDEAVDTLQAHLDAEATTRENADAALTQNIIDETAAREAKDNVLQDRLDAEKAAREAQDADIERISNGLAQEITERTVADTNLHAQILAEIAVVNNEELANVKQYRFGALPFAFIQYQNTDKSLHVGDTVATVGNAYRPRIPVDFICSVEQIEEGASKTYWATFRIDTTGNINVINKYPAAEGTAATDVASALYITKE